MQKAYRLHPMGLCGTVHRDWLKDSSVTPRIGFNVTLYVSYALAKQIKEEALVAFRQRACLCAAGSPRDPSAAAIYRLLSILAHCQCGHARYLVHGQGPGNRPSSGAFDF